MNLPFVSGDQNVFWDALLKLLVLCGLRKQVVHDIHSADLFSRVAEQDAAYAVSNEAYRRDGNLNRWTATMEAAPFFGAMAVSAADYVGAGVDVKSVAAYLGESEDDVIQSLTGGDWLGVSSKDGAALAETVSADKALNDAFSVFRRQLYDDLQAAVRPHQSPEQWKQTELSFALLFCLKQFPGKPLGEAYRLILQQNLERAGLQNVPLSSTLRRFQNNGGVPTSPMFLHCVRYHKEMAWAYNEAVKGGGEAINPLLKDELPFYAAVRQRDGRLVRVNLRLAGRVEDILAAAADEGRGEVAAVLGKAIPLSLDLRLQGPLIMPERGSVYTPAAVRFARLFQTATLKPLDFHPVYRLRFHALDALADVDAAFNLPPYLASAFGAQAVTGRDMAANWRSVVAKAEAEVRRLSGPASRHLESGAAAAWFADAGLVEVARQAQAKVADIRRRQADLFAAVKRGEVKKDQVNAAKAEFERSSEAIGHQRLLQHALGMVDERRAALLKPHLQVIASLSYYDCRPFTHWVRALPGWLEAIQKRAEVVHEVESDTQALLAHVS